MKTANLEILQQSFSKSSPEKRAKLLNFVSGICRGSSSSISEQQMQMLANIAETLIENTDHDALIEAADIFAHIKTTPHSLIYKLAHQECDVAASILENSTVLTDDDLIEIISENGAGYQNHIVKRKVLSIHVTDCLVNKAAQETLEMLLNNNGASFSKNSYTKLAKIGLDNETIAGSIISRPDMPHDIVNKLIEKLDLTGSGKLSEEGEKLRIKFGTQAMEAHKMRSQRELFLPIAKNHIKQISSGKRTIDDCIIDLCKQGHDQALCQVIASFTKTTEAIITAAFNNVSGIHILQYSKALGITREAFLAIATLRTKRRDLPNSQIFYLMRQFDTI